MAVRPRPAVSLWVCALRVCAGSLPMMAGEAEPSASSSGGRRGCRQASAAGYRVHAGLRMTSCAGRTTNPARCRAAAPAGGRGGRHEHREPLQRAPPCCRSPRSTGTGPDGAPAPGRARNSRARFRAGRPRRARNIRGRHAADMQHVDSRLPAASLPPPALRRSPVGARIIPPTAAPSSVRKDTDSNDTDKSFGSDQRQLAARRRQRPRRRAFEHRPEATTSAIQGIARCWPWLA